MTKSGERDTFGIDAFEKLRVVLLDEGVEWSLLGAVPFVRGASPDRAGAALVATVRPWSWAWAQDAVCFGCGAMELHAE